MRKAMNRDRSEWYLCTKRAEIEEILAIARKLTDAGYGDICFELEIEEETTEKARKNNESR